MLKWGGSATVYWKNTLSCEEINNPQEKGRITPGECSRQSSSNAGREDIGIYVFIDYIISLGRVHRERKDGVFTAKRGRLT
jgi:hypothetical protein